MKKRTCNHAQQREKVTTLRYHLVVMTLFAIRKLCILFLTTVVRQFSRYYQTGEIKLNLGPKDLSFMLILYGIESRRKMILHTKD